MKHFYLACLTVCFVSCSSPKQEDQVSVITEEPQKEKRDSLKLFLEHYNKFFATNFNVSECPGAAVVIVKDSTVIYKKGFGVKKIHTKDSVDENTVFRIASLSKGVTAVLAGNMLDRNELQWGQRVKEAVKGFNLRDKEQANRIKLRHVLSHTTGLYKYSYTNLIQRGLSLDKIVNNFKSIGVVEKEGHTYAYQNAMFSVVEKVMEHNTGVSFETLLKERIFDPSGMSNASSTFSAIKNNPNVAQPHKYNHYSKKYFRDRLHSNYYNVAAAGGINASISDMGEYLKILLGHYPNVISKESLRDIFNPVICTSTEDTYVNLWDGVSDSYYAMGWRVLDYRGRRVIYHGGNVNQYKTQLLIDPENGIGICALFNAPNPFNGPVIPTFLNYYDFYLDVID
ncbi:serine hydrolase domain-containing protein [Aquimarina sp. 2201CG1-2-11]|uniref:serine hydrolase domain-containing protein n=1 Tax=Aquimarina discodermiae TaxID=3231043 RepID=UPI0034633253